MILRSRSLLLAQTNVDADPANAVVRPLTRGVKLESDGA